jgi:hypothetical protein
MEKPKSKRDIGMKLQKLQNMESICEEEATGIRLQRRK